MTACSKAQSYRLLLDCYHTGQLTEKQWNEHLKDEQFAAWVERQERDQP